MGGAGDCGVLAERRYGWTGGFAGAFEVGAGVFDVGAGAFDVGVGVFVVVVGVFAAGRAGGG